MIDPLTMFRRGIYQIREAAYLELLARAGGDGLPLPTIAGTMGEVTSTAHTICRKLEAKGYVQSPARDRSTKGGPNIWKISDAGRALVALQTSVTLIHSTPRRKTAP